MVGLQFETGWYDGAFIILVHGANSMFAPAHETQLSDKLEALAAERHMTIEWSKIEYDSGFQVILKDYTGPAPVAGDVTRAMQSAAKEVLDFIQSDLRLVSAQDVQALVDNEAMLRGSPYR